MVGLKTIRLPALSATGALAAFFLLIASSFAAEEPLFEGYYRVLKSGQHAGYYVMRHEYDAKKKQFTATTFMQIEGDEPMTESIKAVADEAFYPVTYAYTAMGSGVTRTIDVKASKGKMTGTLVMKGQKEKISRDLPKHTISSLFLVYSILRSPEGLKPNTTYKEYSAVAEELAEVKTGQVKVKGVEDLNGIKVYRVENDFLDTTSNNLVSEGGEVLATLSPSQKIAIELMPNMESAVGKFRVQNALLKSLFGDIPKGLRNSLAKNGKKESK